MRGTATDGNAALIRGVVVSTTRDGAIGWTRFYLDPVTDDPFVVRAGRLVPISGDPRLQAGDDVLVLADPAPASRRRLLTC